MNATKRIAATIAMAAVCLMMCMPVSAVSTKAMSYDAVPSKAKGELLGEEPQGVMHRRGFVASAGYMFGL